MFRMGEKGCAYEDPATGEFRSVVVLAGFFDVVAPGILAVLRRREDGQRVLVMRSGEFVEVVG